MDGLPVSDMLMQVILYGNYDGCISFFQSLLYFVFKLG